MSVLWMSPFSTQYNFSGEPSCTPFSFLSNTDCISRLISFPFANKHKIGCNQAHRFSSRQQPCWWQAALISGASRAFSTEIPSGSIHTRCGGAHASKWILLTWMGVFTMDGSNIKGFTHICVLASSVDWASMYHERKSGGWTLQNNTPFPTVFCRATKSFRVKHLSWAWSYCPKWQ